VAVVDAASTSTLWSSAFAVAPKHAACKVAKRPEGASDWIVRGQIQFSFPTDK